MSEDMNEPVRDPRRGVCNLRQGDPDDGIAPETGFEDPCDDLVRTECGAGNDGLLPEE